MEINLKRIKLLAIIFFFNVAFSYCQSLEGFSFIFSQGENSYNSSTYIYKKDMGIGSPFKFKLTLTNEEMQTIYNKLKEIDFWNYPFDVIYPKIDEAGLKTQTYIIPSSKGSMEVFFKLKTKTIRWTNSTIGASSKNTLYENLKELETLINEIIAKKKEYKNSPPPKGFRL